MPTCPAGHDSESTDFCDVCGMRMDSPAQASVPVPAVSPPDPDWSAAAPGRVATAPSYVATAPSQAVAGPSQSAALSAAATPEWTAVVTADRAYFDSVVAASGPDAAAVQFPAYCPERRFRLFGPEMRIGRRSPSRGLDPEIDLTGPPADPGVSHLHAVLISDEYGGWTVFDPGSANGTLVNGREMAAGSRLRLRDGDRICVGAWTMLTIRAE